MAWPADEVQADPSQGLALCQLAMGLDGAYRRSRVSGGEPAERLNFDLGLLRSAACVNACLMLHEGDVAPEQVREFLIEEGCAQPTWASTRLRFMQDSLRAPFLFAYYLGYRSVAKASEAWRGDRSSFYASLYGRMHSPRSLSLAAQSSTRSP